MKRNAVVLMLTLALGCTIAAQTAPPAPNDQAKPAAAKNDISGMYSFLKEGEFVQINQEEGGVITGFVSRYGDDATDKKTFLDQFFSKGALDGAALTFETKVVHGTWFSFSGTVQRGPGKTPADEGYRLLRGTVTRHKTDDKGKDVAESRELEMKSFPADVDEDDE